MSYELTGKLIAKYDIVQRTETFKTREFVIEQSEIKDGRTFTSYAKFQCVQDKTSIVENVSIGADIKVYFNINGTRWEKDGKTNYITNLTAWRIEALAGSAAPAQASAGNNTVVNNEPMQPVDDLPF